MNIWQGEEDALPRDIRALKMQAMHTFGSNKIFAASDFFTYQASTLLYLPVSVDRGYILHSLPASPHIWSSQAPRL